MKKRHHGVCMTSVFLLVTCTTLEQSEDAQEYIGCMSFADLEDAVELDREVIVRVRVDSESEDPQQATICFDGTFRVNLLGSHEIGDTCTNIDVTIANGDFHTTYKAGIATLGVEGYFDDEELHLTVEYIGSISLWSDYDIP